MKIIKNKKPVKAILIIILILGLPTFLAFYEQLFLAYYQETIADKWASYFVLPFLIISVIYLQYETYVKYSKSEIKKLAQTLKKAFLEAIVVFLLFMYILRPILSGTLIFINANIGTQTEEIVEGIITNKRDYNGSRSYEYKLTIKTGSEVLIFDTDIKTITSHYNGDNFKETMYRGSLGLLYKR